MQKSNLSTFTEHFLKQTERSYYKTIEYTNVDNGRLYYNMG